MNRPFSALSSALLAAALSTSSAFADTLNVPGDFPTIQAAIDAAVDGDEVVVADGTYTGDGNRDMNFGGRAITVRSENGPDACIIDLQADETDPHRAFEFNNGESADSVVEGFTIQNGFMISGGAVTFNQDYSTAVFRSCVFRHNVTESWGGAVQIGDAMPTFIGCQFLENSGSSGGAVTVWTGLESAEGHQDGPSFHGCLFSGNTVTSVGGAVRVDRGTSAEFVNCTFVGNQASQGGAIGLSGIVIRHASAAVVNSTFVGNQADEGGAIWGIHTGSTTVGNSILWNDTPDEIAATGGVMISVRYSSVQGGEDGEGNINADPMFVDPESGDLRLSAGSPCLDAGDNTAGPGDVDLDGNPRFVHDPCAADTGVLDGMNPPVDMGAYEFQPPCPTDLDCNGDVGAVDLLTLLGAWGSCAGCPEDVDDNGDVGLADLLIVFAAWGDCEGFADSDRDGIPDAYDNCPDTSNPFQEDCDGAGTGDACDPDCNENGTPDGCDIADMTSDDCNGNGVPDECDIASGTSPDHNGNNVPDECDPDCNGNGVLDDLDIANGTSPDCNGNGVPDECDIASGTSQDHNGNNVPDECDPDCDGNGVPDDLDIADGNSPDCNANGVPDECDIANGDSTDVDGNGVPDECDPAPSNDMCAQAQLVLNQVPFSTVHATTDGPMEPTECSANGDDDVQSDVWFRGFAICTGTITFTLSDLDYPARMAIYFDLSCPAGPDEAAACVQAPGETSITLPVDIGQGLRIRIGGEHGAQGTGTLTVECTAEAPQ